MNMVILIQDNLVKGLKCLIRIDKKMARVMYSCCFKNRTVKMTNSIQLTPFSDETGEVVATAKIWGQEIEVFLDEDEFCDTLPNQQQVDKIIKHLIWLNDNKKPVIDFALECENFVGNFNDWIEKMRLKKYGKAKLYDGTVLTQSVSYEKVCQSILLSSVYAVFFDDEITLSVDLVTEPDYFGGHTFNVEINDDFLMEFGGVNG